MKFLICGAALLLGMGAALLVSCPGCSHSEARARNAAIGADQALDLQACREDAKKIDAGDRWATYSACADRVDAKHGKKP